MLKWTPGRRRPGDARRQERGGRRESRSCVARRAASQTFPAINRTFGREHPHGPAKHLAHLVAMGKVTVE